MGIVVMVEDMQHFEHDSMWRKVNGEDLPIAEVHFNESCQKSSIQFTVTSHITRKLSVNLMK